MTREYDALVFIGRFQPFHNGHKRVIDRALELSEKVIILVGSTNVGRSMRNPFTFEERKDVISKTYDPKHFGAEYAKDSVLQNRQDRLTILPLNDNTYNDTRWIEQVQGLVAENTKSGDRIGLIGCAKDHTGYYLELFPTWRSERVQFLDPINATDLRELYWSYGATQKAWNADTGTHTDPPSVSEYVPVDTLEFLQEFETTELYNTLKIEKQFIETYKKSVQKYPRIEHTVDAVVVQSGHILLIRRRSEPGRGLWALPGGFINPDEKLEDSMIRELREETKIKVPEPVLRGSIKASKTFDDPHRSARGRLITQAFHIALPRQTSLPKVKGSDDADKAAWVPLNELDPTRLFEDHYFIIDDMLGGV